MNMPTKIGTLNLCLCLKNKKDLVKGIIIENKIDVLCLQETELEINLNHNLMSFPGFNNESEINTSRSRVGIYVSSKLDYVRRSDLEGIDSHLVIIDIKAKTRLRIINLYRSFNPPDNQTARSFFRKQLIVLKQALKENTILMGDFNLDWKKNLATYAFKNYFDDLEATLGDMNLTQLISFPTWSRVVNNEL